MSRDGNGNYTLPAGNPVISGEVIDTNWANPTLADIGNELTNSLSRSGKGGMLVPFRLADGSVASPSLGFTSEPSSGLFKSATNDLRMSVAGIGMMRWTAGGAEAWDVTNSVWVNLATVIAANGTAIGVNAAAIANITTPPAVNSGTPASGFGGFRYTLTDAGATLNLFTT
jgi:hypothetical protein